MKLFKEDPIKYMRYFIGVELLPDGYEIAQKVHDQYLNRSVSYDLQLREIEQVSILTPLTSSRAEFLIEQRHTDAFNRLTCCLN